MNNTANCISANINSYQGGPFCDIWLGFGLASAVQNFPLHKYIHSRVGRILSTITTAQQTVPKGALSSKISLNVLKVFFFFTMQQVLISVYELLYLLQCEYCNMSVLKYRQHVFEMSVLHEWPWPAGTDEAGQGEEWQILAQ